MFDALEYSINGGVFGGIFVAMFEWLSLISNICVGIPCRFEAYPLVVKYPLIEVNIEGGLVREPSDRYNDMF